MCWRRKGPLSASSLTLGPALSLYPHPAALVPSSSPESRQLFLLPSSRLMNAGLTTSGCRASHHLLELEELRIQVQEGYYWAPQIKHFSFIYIGGVVVQYQCYGLDLKCVPKVHVPKTWVLACGTIRKWQKL